MPSSLPILYSFRRCPYAMRARLAILASGVRVTLREVSLRDKPQQMLAASPKGTVPVLLLPNGRVIDESLDIMRWALEQNDPLGWRVAVGEAEALIAVNDGPFKLHLDQTKYANRFPELDPDDQRAAALDCLLPLEARLANAPFVLGERASMADAALFPFVRQFSKIDEEKWNAEPLPNVRRWLRLQSTGPAFEAVMTRYPRWAADQEDSFFPPG